MASIAWLGLAAFVVLILVWLVFGERIFAWTRTRPLAVIASCFGVSAISTVWATGSISAGLAVFTGLMGILYLVVTVTTGWADDEDQLPAIVLRRKKGG